MRDIWSADVSVEADDVAVVWCGFEFPSVSGSFCFVFKVLSAFRTDVLSFSCTAKDEVIVCLHFQRNNCIIAYKPSSVPSSGKNNTIPIIGAVRHPLCILRSLSLCTDQPDNASGEASRMTIMRAKSNQMVKHINCFRIYSSRVISETEEGSEAVVPVLVVELLVPPAPACAPPLVSVVRER